MDTQQDIVREIVGAVNSVRTNEYTAIARETLAVASATETAIAGEYEEIIKKAVLAALASGVIPFSDAIIMTGIWGTMIVSLAVKSGHPMSMERAVKLAGAVLTGVATFNVGTKLFTTALHMFPGAGTIMAIGVDSFINALQTYRLGKTFAGQLDRTTISLLDGASLVGHILNLHPIQLFQDTKAVLDLVTGS